MKIKESSNIKSDCVVFLGETTFPIGLGAIQRMTLMSKALILANYWVVVLCRKGNFNYEIGTNVGINGNFEGIQYIYTSGTSIRSTRFLIRNYRKIFGMIGEYKMLRALKKNYNLRGAIVSNYSAFHILRYRIYSKLLNFPIVLNFVELAISLDNRTSLTTKLNDYVVCNFLIKTLDGALPISDGLVNYYNKIAPKKPFKKIPILCDFTKFDIKQQELESDKIIFTYCGAASYYELVDFVIDAFDELENLADNVFFQLILGGKRLELEKVQEKIQNSRYKTKIQVFTNVPHQEIPKYYSLANALLIPLRPSIQDESRFPHKIGEYLASGTPMITTSFGEIKNYDFIDEKNCLIAESYNKSSFAEKMNFIIHNPHKSREIGLQGRKLGLKHFDYSKYGPIISEYLAYFG